MSDLMLDVSQAHELKLAFRRGDWTNEEIKRLCEGDILTRVRGALRGTHEIKPIDHVLDLATIPGLPFNGATIVEHQGTGIVRLERREDDLYLDGKKIELHLSPKQKKGTIGGNDLRKYLEGKPVLGAAVLDYLLAHPELIPDSWKVNEAGNTLYIFFWGTIYRGADGHLYVRYLCWFDERWVSDYYWLDDDWSVDDPSAQLAS